MILGIYPKEEEAEIVSRSKKGRQDAANRLQWKFIKGFDDATIPISIINAPYIGTFPYGYKDVIYRGGKFSHCADANDYSVSFINLPFLSSYSKFLSTKKQILKWLDQKRETKKAVILYAMNSYMGRCAKYIKKVAPEVKVCMIVPDLPEYAYNTNNRSVFYRFFINNEINQSYRFLQYIDCFVGLTEQMHNRLDPGKPFCVVDTIMDNARPAVTLDKYVKNKKIITYTGTLSFNYGIKDLLEAFMKVHNPDLQLFICGSGHLNEETFLKECAAKDARIIYGGLLSYDEVCRVQRDSFVLVNPRKNDSDYTSYSFPSKVAEYMSTGIPVLIFKLDGITEDYYDKTLLFDNYNSMSEAISRIAMLDRETLWNIAHKASAFVEKEKSPIVQSKKVYSLIESLY